MSTLAPGQSVGRYKIVRFLGAGAMGEVYLADDPQIDRQLAIKTVRLAGRESDVEDRKRRLLREARAAGRMLHPNIVTLFDAGEAEGLLYLAFEFVEGRDLAGRMDSPERLTLREVLRIGRSVAAALEFAHRQGIVHRDIKPGNILLDAQGGVKVGDFGIAKVAGQETELTMAGSVLGSPQYLSPEQIRGEDLDGRSDLFSLGVVLYEILSRKRPFAGDTLTALCYSILTKEPPPLSDLRSVPPRLEALIGRMLAKDREERIGTAAEVARELSAIEMELAEETLLSPAGGEAEKTALLPRRATTGSGPGLPPLPPPPPPSPSTKMTVPRASQAPPVPPVPPPAAFAPAAPRTAPPVRPVKPGLGGGSKALIAVGALALLMVVGGVGGWMVARKMGLFGVSPQQDKDGEATPAPATPTGPAAAEPSSSAPAGSAEVREAAPLPSPAVPSPSPSPQSSGTKPPSTPSGGSGTVAPSGQVRVPEPGERPSPEAKESAPIVVPPPQRLPEPEPSRPAPVQEEERPRPGRNPADRTVASGLQATFQVEPPDAQLLVDRTSLGPASEWTGKKGGQPYTFPGADTYRLRVKKDGMRTAEIDIVVSERGGVTPISVRLRPLAGAGAEAQELATFRTSDAVSFKVRPASASFAVDGVPKGPVKQYSGGFGRSGWLSLPAGRHRISITAPGYQQQDVIVDVTGSESEDRVPITLSLVAGG